MAISIDADVSPRVITVLAPATSISVQQIVDLVRAWEHDVSNLEHPLIVTASGKDDLGDGVSAAVTVQLQNAVLGFEERVAPTFVQCRITGGNLTAVDGVGDTIEPIQTTDYTQVVYSKSVSATLINGDAVDPWLTALPGAYGAGTAGKIVGDNIDAAISSRLAASALAAIADAIWDEATSGHSIAGTFGEHHHVVYSGQVSGATSTTTLIDSIGRGPLERAGGHISHRRSEVSGHRHLRV